MLEVFTLQLTFFCSLQQQSSLHFWVYPNLKRSSCIVKKRIETLLFSDDTASMIKGGGYVGARTRRQPPT
jgi:hypothetical protein